MTILGNFVLFIIRLFRNRERFSVYVQQTIEECILLGIDSVFIIAIVSTFLGAVSAIQVAHNLMNPFISLYVVGLIVRDMTVLELAPTITCIVLAGKVGSSIAGGLGTMRITEQVDALEVMGINASSYLVLPKIIACIVMFPMLVVMAGTLCLAGGYMSTVYTGVLTAYDYTYGIRYNFDSYTIYVAMVKAFTFATVISTLSSYKGFQTRGGALEVGKASTEAVTNSCIGVLLSDYAVAQLML